jgi:Activator of Hsp90 ATPase homolog 1-like protein
MIEPLMMSFEVACSPEHAFATWTSRISNWWPEDHTITGQAGLEVVLEPGVGGRIYERTPAGTEHEWGEVTVWEPPARLAYLWHLRRDRRQATDVEIRFVALAADRTRVEIEHGGWERLGDAAADWRDRNRSAWRTLLPHFSTATTGARP